MLGATAARILREFVLVLDCFEGGSFAAGRFVDVDFFCFVAILPEFEIGDLWIYSSGKSKAVKQPMPATFIFVLQNCFYNGAAGVFFKVAENVEKVVVFFGLSN